MSKTVKFKDTREFTVRSSADAFEQFMKGTLWLDMSDEVKVWLTEVRDLLENPDTPEHMTALLRGVAEALRNVLMLPENMANNLRADAEKQNKEDKDNG